jgi:hypothetical protein
MHSVNAETKAKLGCFIKDLRVREPELGMDGGKRLSIFGKRRNRQKSFINIRVHTMRIFPPLLWGLEK